MSRGPQKFRQADVAKAVRGAVAAGVEVRAVEVNANGKIVVFLGKADVELPGSSNEWDIVK